MSFKIENNYRAQGAAQVLKKNVSYRNKNCADSERERALSKVLLTVF